MKNFAPRIVALVLCGTALAACSTLDMSGRPDVAQSDDADKGSVDKQQAAKNMAGDVDSGVRQAAKLRAAGDYAGAVHLLSQLMMVAADDPRVVTEYGKTLTQQGRAQDAIPFLNRAAELQSTNWSVYSAMGVAYDQLGDAKSAANAYDHALSLHPGDAGVLNNYALSRLQAKDPAGAQKLMDQARLAGGASNPKIARNMDMIKNMQPGDDVEQTIAAVKKAAPDAPVAVADAHAPMPQGPTAAPRQLVAQAPLPQQSGGVVMQKVPYDPFAGPVAAQGASRQPAMHGKVARAKAPKARMAAKSDGAKPLPGNKPDIRPASRPKVAAAAKAPAMGGTILGSRDDVPALRITASAY